MQILAKRRRPKESFRPIRSRPEISEITFLPNSKNEKKFQIFSLNFVYNHYQRYYFIVKYHFRENMYAVEP